MADSSNETSPPLGGLVSFDGGAGNRTPVPKHFREGIYVCSLSIPDVHPLRGYAAFVGPVSDRLDSGTTIGQIFLAGTAAEAVRVVVPVPRVPASPN